MSNTAQHQKEVQTYYDRLGPLLPLELTDRGDERFWTETVEDPRVQSVLELGCGSGRISRLLAPRVQFLAGVDLSSTMLCLARRQLEGFDHVGLLQADIRFLALGRRFDLILAADDPLCHMVEAESRRQALEAARRHLRPQGRVILDLYWLAEETLEEAAGEGGLEKVKTVETAEGQLRVHECRRFQLERNRFEASYRYWLADVFIREVQFEGHFWKGEEIASSLDSAGLAPVNAWGGYDRREWERMNSPRMILECKRKDETIDEF